MTVVYLGVSFFSCIIGTICGIGGGVIVKPILDMFAFSSITTINFLSTCMVFVMSCFSVIKSFFSGKNIIKLRYVTPLAIGAAIGGFLGSNIFVYIKQLFENPNTVGAVQSACLMLISSGVLIYTVYKGKIKTYNMTGIIPCIGIGLTLGLVSSFLGIGGGPINLVVLCFFFGMDSKMAAINSLYIILISKVTNILATIFTNNVPEFNCSHFTIHPKKET